MVQFTFITYTHSKNDSDLVVDLHLEQSSFFI